MAKPPAITDRPSPEAYHAWLRRRFRKVPEVAAGKAYHDEVAARLRAQTEGSTFWKELLSHVPAVAADYYIATEYELMAWPHPGHFQTKTWDSFLEKTYRKNVRGNEGFPDAPVGGWLLPPHWYARIDDVVRTTFVVRYLDGVHELGQAIEQTARDLGLEVEPELVASESGYYAAHLVVRQELVVPTVGLQPVTLPVGIEIQVTTQAKEVITKLLHRSYEKARLADDSPAWRWDYDGRDFAANYLGHILHYLEGRVMNVRATDRKGEAW